MMSDTYTLLASTTPTVSIGPMSTTLSVGSPANLTCSYSNSTSVSIQRDDVVLSTTSVPLSTSTSQFSLSLPSIQAGRYDCVAANPLGAVKSTAIVVATSQGMGGGNSCSCFSLTLSLFQVPP